jgi:(p)ppGpp synthase/HD superfamily hydrolase
MSDDSPWPKFLSDDPRFVEALAYACRLLAHQSRKSTDIPYVSHLFGVASIAIEYGADMDEAIGALLHDAAEDCGGRPRLAEIRAKFGESVAEIVEGCTDTFETPKPSWTKRKAAYIAHLRHSSSSVRLVSAADKLHNARSILKDFRVHKKEVFGRFKKETEWDTVWYYSRLAREFLELGGGEIARELDRVVRKLEKELLAIQPDGREDAYARLDAELDKARQSGHQK